MISRNTLTQFLDGLLNIHAIPEDKSNNGLQIEGKNTVEKVVGGVDACGELYKKAVQASADFIFVHHGESWGEGIKYFTGHIAARFQLLFENNLSLYAAHLPLDAHPRLGHNARITSSLGLKNIQPFARYAGINIGLQGQVDTPVSVNELSGRINETLNSQTMVYDFWGKKISNIGVVSGSGASTIYECKNLGIECLVTGEVDHTSYHPAKELGMCLITAGHYKTEVPGVVVVLDEIRNQFDIDCQFIDIPTGL